MRALVIGYGSAGRRHIEILDRLGYQVSIVSNHATGDRKFSVFKDISDAYARAEYALCIIASVTSEHIEHFREVLKNSSKTKICIEKPLCSVISDLKGLNFRNQVYVGYNMRFLSGIAIIKRNLENERVIRAAFVVSTYLPNWRTNRTYQKGYSTRKELGGGVLRELSHEIDLIHYILGTPKVVYSRVYNSGVLCGDAEDGCDVLLESGQCSYISLSLNYHSKNSMRYIQIDTEKHSYYYDILSSRLTVDGVEVSECNSMTESYVEMHRSILVKDESVVASYEDGLNVVRCIEQVEARAEG
ncbi:Gfo/Idh/MocA family oxidoreductase [Betaproteobacteria bacterium LSUCC0117]|nr:Gfo/Idh/MocA family oxidoreductase [Betaproteobacteria bacterium LSUCC0117]